MGVYGLPNQDKTSILTTYKFGEEKAGQTFDVNILFILRLSQLGRNQWFWLFLDTSACAMVSIFSDSVRHHHWILCRMLPYSPDIFQCRVANIVMSYLAPVYNLIYYTDYSTSAK